MTETTRLEMIQTTIRCALDEGTTLSNAFGDLTPTVNELLKLAFYEPKLPSTYNADTVLLIPDEDENEQLNWEETQRNQKEMDDILSALLAPMKITIPPDNDDDDYDADEDTDDEEDDHDCWTCGANCVPYQTGENTFWICEDCENQRGCAYCSGCQYCMASNGYDGSDEV